MTLGNLLLSHRMLDKRKLPNWRQNSENSGFIEIYDFKLCKKLEN